MITITVVYVATLLSLSLSLPLILTHTHTHSTAKHSISAVASGELCGCVGDQVFHLVKFYAVYSALLLLLSPSIHKPSIAAFISHFGFCCRLIVRLAVCGRQRHRLLSQWVKLSIVCVCVCVCLFASQPQRTSERLKHNKNVKLQQH